MVNERGKIEEEKNLPKSINDKLNKYKSYEQQKVHLETEKYKIPQNNDYNNNIYGNNDEYNDMTNFYNAQDNSEIVPYFQEPSLGINNDFNFNKDF